jgi:3-oxoacyl-[acyl-carrier protein] reductase
MQNFTGQTALVTGATRGIGRAIVLGFLQQGARVIGIYAGNHAAADVLHDECHPYAEMLHLQQCDISDRAQVQTLYSGIEAQFSTLDILINNAGIRRDAVLAMMAEDDWQQVIDTNLTGTFLMTKPAVLLMMKKKYGRIITITSPVSHLGFAGQSNYAASKAGQIGLTRSLAKETAKKGITVNCISPGFIATDFINDLGEEQLAAYKKMVPMRRFGTPQEVADAVLFLASGQASYITGSVLEITGGL